MYWTLAYLSSAVNEFDRQSLLELLSKARSRNSDRGVSGMLLYHEGNFLQILEGRKEDVYEVFDRISKDPRHKDVIRLIEDEIETRSFPDWSMGFCELGDLNPNQIEGFSTILQHGWNDAEFEATQSRTKTLIRTFRAGTGR
ncbi:MAG: BLUF domain-containing protein [Planctomycetota bacterium]